MNERVVVVRKWAEPHVTAFVDVASIGAKMDVDEYLESLVAELPNISLVFTKASLLEKLKLAHVEVAKAMRETTKYLT